MNNRERLSFNHEQGRAQSWETLDSDLRAAVEHAVDQVADELAQAGFVGAYQHGSLTTGSFYRPKSDVDILFVIDDELTTEQRERVARTFCDLSDQLPLTATTRSPYFVEPRLRSSTTRCRTNSTTATAASSRSERERPTSLACGPTQTSLFTVRLSDNAGPSCAANQSKESSDLFL